MAFQCKAMLPILLLVTSVSSRIIGKYQSNAYEWDHIIFTQRWPESTCEYLNATGKHACEIPSQTKTWVVHGLWPSLGDSIGPNYCNNSWSFDASKIESILPELKVNWTNLYKDGELTSLWKHEWEKHGTCAASLDSLRGELKYFSTGLSLNKKYDILGVLSKRGISPSHSQQYQTEDVIGVLKEEFGYRTCIGCIYIKGIGQLFYQVYICLDKSLSIIDCPRCGKSCQIGEDVVYNPVEENVV